MSVGRGAAASLALALVVLAGPFARTPTAWTAAGVGLGLAAGLAAARLPSRLAAWLLAAGALAVLAVVAGSPSVALGPLARWFSPSEGLFYRNPVIWLGVAGGLTGAARAALGAALLASAVYAVLPAGTSAAVIEAAVPALLFPAIAAALEGLRRSAEAAPLLWLGAGGALLVVSNFLFMEQYRRNLIPRDDTVSFAQVAATNGALFRGAFGSPRSWPASWVFAARHRVSPAEYDTVAGAPWRFESGEAEAFALQGPAADRLWVALRRPVTIDVSLEAAGNGVVDVEVNGTRAAAVPLAPQGGEARVRIASTFWRRGLNELRLVPAAGTNARWTRLTLRRAGGGA